MNCRVGSLLLLVGLVSSCASFSERPSRPAYSGPAERVAVQITTSEDAKLQVGRDKWIDAPFDADLAETAADAVWQSGWVREAGSGEASVELHLHVVSYQGQGPALLSALTAFLIPDAVDHRLEVTLEIPDVGRCARVAETRTWYQTFLILAYPFRSPAYGRMKTVEALGLACTAELLRNIHGPNT